MIRSCFPLAIWPSSSKAVSLEDEPVLVDFRSDGRHRNGHSDDGGVLVADAVDFPTVT